MFSVVVLTFNSNEFIQPCLDALFAQEYPHFEVIVVDNGSTDATGELVKNNYSRVRLIANKENLGSCRGRNQGIAAAQQEWILSLDCDVVLANDFLLQASREIERLPESVGILQPKIINADKETIYSCGIRLSALGRFHDIGSGRPAEGAFDERADIFGGCSAACFYRRKMLEEIKESNGYFDERFFFLVEDVDLSWRAQNKNWRTRYYPAAICYHRGMSSGWDRKARQFLSFRNRKLMLAKHKGSEKRPLVRPLVFLYDCLREPYLLFTNSYARSRRLPFCEKEPT